MPQSQPANPPIPATVLCSKDALLEEYAAITRNDWKDGKPPPRTTQWLSENEAELCAAPKTALCLSGGGIRSAAFCLGALQALAAQRLLGEFNYLSTVSGGGYIGAWLATIMHGGGRGNGALSAANKALTDPTDTALRSLRNYTNFLIPEGGFGSSDTWSAIVLWLRNVLLNWLVFAPVLLALAIVPRLYRELLWDVSPFWGAAALLVGLACLLTGTIMVCRSVPTHAYDANTRSKDGRYGVAASTVQHWVVVPVLAWTFLAPAWFSAVSSGRYGTVPFLSWTFAPASLGAFVALVVGYGIAALTLGRDHYKAFARNGIYWTIGAALSAFLLQLGATIGQQMPATMLAVLGPLWIIGAQVLHSTLYVGLRWSAAYAELDREWLARLNGEKLIPMLAWSVLAAVTLILPVLVFEQWPTTYAAILGVASGPVGAWLGRSAQSFGAAATADKTGAAWWTGMVREAAITLATLLFAATLFMLLGRLERHLRRAARFTARRCVLAGSRLADRFRCDHPAGAIVRLLRRADQHQPVLATRRLPQSAGARLHRHRAAAQGTQARRLYAFRSSRQSAYAGPVSGQATARHSVPSGERHPQLVGRRAERLGRAQGCAIHHHAAARRRRLSR
jgi:hypothetical protein